MTYTAVSSRARRPWHAGPPLPATSLPIARSRRVH